MRACFFMLVFFNFIACIGVKLLNKDRKLSFICYKMSLVCFYLQLYILLLFFFGFALYLFSNFITVLGLVKFYPLSVAESS